MVLISGNAFLREVKAVVVIALFVLLPIHVAGQLNIRSTSDYGCTNANSPTIFYLENAWSCNNVGGGLGTIPSPSDWIITKPIGARAPVVTYNLTSSNPVAYNNILVTFLDPGDYRIEANYLCSGAWAFAQYYSTVTPSTNLFKVEPTITPSVNIPGGQDLCADRVHPFSAQTFDGGTNTTYTAAPYFSWVVNGNTILGANGSTMSYGPSDGDQVEVFYTSNRRCMLPNTVSARIRTSTIQPTPVAMKLKADKYVLNQGERVAFSLHDFIGIGEDPDIVWKINGNPAPPSDVAGSPYQLTYNQWNFVGATTVTCSLTTKKTCAAPRPVVATVNVFSCGTLPSATPTFSSETYGCAMKLLPVVQGYPNCKLTYSWNFGDNTPLSSEEAPLHAYAAGGNYNVTLTVTYNCSGCTTSRTTSSTVAYVPQSQPIVSVPISVSTDKRSGVVGSSASTFSDAWPVEYWSDLYTRNPYWTGAAGVWRAERDYVYRADRLSSSSVDLSIDGTYDLEMFRWPEAEYDAVPGWINTRKVTKYSRYGFELENQDVLGNYSSAVYDYGGQLPAATGVNMKSNEFAFTSFETYDGRYAGNWNITPGGTGRKFQYFQVRESFKHAAVIEAPTSALSGVSVVNVLAKLIKNNNRGESIVVSANPIVCITPYPGNSAWSIVVLKRAPFDNVWSGQIQVATNITGQNATEDNTYAHTGKKSLRIAGSNQVFRQDAITLEPAKKYFISGWVSNKSTGQKTPEMGSNLLGVNLKFYGQSGTSTGPIEAVRSTGAIIEGWQQFRKEVTVPAGTTYFEIEFQSGGTTAWYDDLRIHPSEGNMKGYVYSLIDYKLVAILDEENFASLFYYDREGNLYLTKKETVDGVKTISENISYQPKR